MIYALFLEYGFLEDKWSRLVLAAVFVNDVIALICVNLVYHKFNFFTLAFALAMALTALALPRPMKYVAGKYDQPSTQIELRFIFTVILGISLLADAGNMRTAFGAFLLGFVFANSLHNHAYVLSKLRSVTFSILAPVFFIRAGMLISVPAAVQNVELITGILLMKAISKFAMNLIT